MIHKLQDRKKNTDNPIPDCYKTIHRNRNKGNQIQLKNKTNSPNYSQ